MGTSGRVLATALTAWTHLAPCAAWAQRVELRFDSLPSAQGFKYLGVAPEEQVYSVDGTRLVADSFGLGPLVASYHWENLIDPSRPFRLDLTARVTASGNEWGDFSAHLFPGNGDNFRIAFGTTLLAVVYQGSDIHLLDGTRFHDYRLEGLAGFWYALSLDGVLVEGGAPTPPNICGCTYCGLMFGPANCPVCESGGDLPPITGRPLTRAR